MIVQSESWANISLLHITNAHIEKDAPVVIFLHGFMSGKEHNLHYAYNLVRQGVRVLLPDALYHGERDQGMNDAQMSMAFWEIVFQSIQEVGMLHRELLVRGYKGKVAVAGTSMGGITTAGCLMDYEWIDTAAILMGAVSYEKLLDSQLDEISKLNLKFPLSDTDLALFRSKLANYDAFKHTEVFEHVPLFFWHGKRDPRVPFNMSYDFYTAQKAAKKASNIEYMMEEKAGHAVSRTGILKMADFLVQHLA